MTKHRADHRTAPTGSRVKNFLRLEHSPSAAPRALHQRPQTTDDAKRLQHFLRIARGQQA
ncbi:MAG: hypothetical protein CFE33_13500 [Pseudorhodobacter sp. PARRP1]|nr:MAG: hypothetical protein CFE33_13500 [Pseudorhodobacter sp. PARRP1]